MKRVAVFLAEGFEEIEAITVIDYLRRAGAEVSLVAAVDSGKNSLLVCGSHGISVLCSIFLDEWFSKNLEQKNLPDAIYLPGGMPGAKNLSESEKILRTILACAQGGKIVSALCASPAVVLYKSGILDGKNYTCYPGMEVGGKIQKDVPFVFDQNVLTGRGPGTAEQFSIKLIEILFGEEKAEQIKIGSCIR